MKGNNKYPEKNPMSGWNWGKPTPITEMGGNCKHQPESPTQKDDCCLLKLLTLSIEVSVPSVTRWEKDLLVFSPLILSLGLKEGVNERVSERVVIKVKARSTCTNSRNIELLYPWFEYSNKWTPKSRINNNNQLVGIRFPWGKSGDISYHVIQEFMKWLGCLWIPVRVEKEFKQHNLWFNSVMTHGKPELLPWNYCNYFHFIMWL